MDEPKDWPQKAGRRAPFPPGDGSDEWEIIVDAPGPGERVQYHVRSTGEVWRKDADGYYAPFWLEIPPIVRRAVGRNLANRVTGS